MATKTRLKALNSRSARKATKPRAQQPEPRIIVPQPTDASLASDLHRWTDGYNTALRACLDAGLRVTARSDGADATPGEVELINISREYL